MAAPRDSLAALLSATRRRLFLITLGSIVFLVLAIGLSAAFAGLRALDADVDRALDGTATAALASLEGELPATEDQSNSEERPAASDTFVLYLDSQGRTVADPSRVVLAGLPDSAAVASARAAGRDLRSVQAGGLSVRLLTLPILRAGQGSSAPVGYVQAGFVLSLHDAESRSLVTVIALVGLLGLAGATLVTLIVTGRALVPVRRALGSQRRFVADASHELRTPAALIRSNAEVLERERLIGPDAQPLVADIIAEADRLGRLVDDLLALASADATGDAVLVRERRPVDLASLADVGARRAEAFASARGVRLVVDPAPAVFVSGDRDRLLQLVLILVDNAVAHSPSGRTVRLVVSRRDGQAELSIDDEGPGIPVDEREHVFEPFARLGDGNGEGRRGSGLGLAIGRRIALAHHGTVRAGSAPGGGARFVVSMPLVHKRHAAEPS